MFPMIDLKIGYANGPISSNVDLKIEFFFNIAKNTLGLYKQNSSIYFA